MKSVGLAAVVRLATFPITAFATFLSTYLIIEHIGAGRYAAVMVVATLFQLVPFADLGLGAVVVNAMADATMPLSEKHRFIKRVFLRLCIAGGAVGVVGFFGASLFSWSTVLGLDEAVEGLDLATAAALTVYGISIPFGVGQRILIGIQQNHVAIALSVTASVTSLGITAFLVAISAPPAALAVGMPAGILATAILTFVVATRRIQFRWRSGRPSEADVPLFSTAAPMLIIMISLPIAFYAGRLVLSHLATLQTLAQYTLAMQIYSPAWSLVAAASISLWPLFAGLRMQGRSAALFSRSISVFFVAGLAGAVCLVGLTPLLARWVSGTEVTVTLGLALALGVLLLTQTLQQVPGMFLTTPRGLRFQAIGVVLVPTSTILGSILLVPVWGAVAPPAVLAVSVLVFQFIPGVLYARASLAEENARTQDPVKSDRAVPMD